MKRHIESIRTNDADENNEQFSSTTTETFLSKSFNVRRIHQIIEDGNAFVFWERFCESAITNLEKKEKKFSVHEFHKNLKKKMMPLSVPTPSGDTLTLYVYNMVMEMKLKEKVNTPETTMEANENEGNGLDFKEISSKLSSFEASCNDYSSEEENEELETSSNSIVVIKDSEPSNSVSSNEFLQLLRQEKEKFNAYIAT